MHSAQNPSVDHHCHPCGLRAVNKRLPHEHTISAVAVLRWAWYLHHPDDPNISEFIANSYRQDRVGDRYVAAARCAEIIVNGECPLFEYAMGNGESTCIVPRERPQLRLVEN